MIAPQKKITGVNNIIVDCVLGWIATSAPSRVNLTPCQTAEIHIKCAIVVRLFPTQNTLISQKLPFIVLKISRIGYQSFSVHKLYICRFVQFNYYT